eukprot:TRINITY_DN12047_c0_g1_i1.p1 TRINITY_DN12047_c0_g1~~TRINITY_DN12047_c0_g1_i1.p1  ORF type:complete len:404 (+),score=36.01 TRINITY_DN12047_c0_g1_i1:256-1467(+)
MTKVAGVPELVASPTPFNKELLQRLTKLKEPYKPCPFIKNRHVETIFAALFRSLPSVKYRREYLRMGDGGTVALDWPISGEDSEIWKTELRESAPVAVLLPGLTGGSGDSYVRHMILRLRLRGWRPAVFNSRGCGDSPVTSPQFYSASYTEDLRQVVLHVRARFPTSKLYGIGWSLGGNILINYLGQEGQQCVLSGAVSLCNPFNLTISNEDFRKGFNNVYDRSLGRGLRKIYRKHAALFEGIGGEYNMDLVARAKTVRDFDEGLTRVSFGYRTVEEYYADASSSRVVERVKIPVLCIQAADDPIAPIRAVPRPEIEANTNFLLVITPTGGHLGWIAGEDAPFGCPWTDPVVMDYLEILDDAVKDEVPLAREGTDDGSVECYKVEDRYAGSERSRETEPLVSY